MSPIHAVTGMYQHYGVQGVFAFTVDVCLVIRILWYIYLGAKQPPYIFVRMSEQVSYDSKRASMDRM